jgi:hypothetical protein
MNYHLHQQFFFCLFSYHLIVRANLSISCRLPKAFYKSFLGLSDVMLMLQLGKSALLSDVVSIVNTAFVTVYS